MQRVSVSAKSSTERGFTLIELLVVVAIISVLAALALPQFAAYKARAFDATALGDLRSSITAQEAFFVDNQAYVACVDADACDTALPGFTASRDSVGTAAVAAFSHSLGVTDQSFTAHSQHLNGNHTYDYDSTLSLISVS